jgi:hypothetical protein
VNRRSAVINSVFLTATAAAVGMEVWFATDHDPSTRPWTDWISSYIPAPVTYAAIAVLVSCLAPHFIEANAKRKKKAMDTTVTIPATPHVAAPKEPLLSVGTDTAVVAAAIAVATAFGLPLNDEQRGAVLVLVAAVAPFAVALVARKKVFSPNTTRAMVVDAANTGVVRTEGAVVPAEKPAGPMYPGAGERIA